MGQLGSVYAAGLAERGMQVASFDVASRSVPDGVHAYEVDVTDRAAIERGVDEVVTQLGVPHVLINNAGLDSPPDAPAEEVGLFEDYPEASFDAVMDVNVKGRCSAARSSVVPWPARVAARSSTSRPSTGSSHRSRISTRSGASRRRPS
jgi:NAD(P)-dependent dehydrogenase (short-subunit alcohol dehydrogenase family)